MCHHYRGSKNPPAHLADEFSARTNLHQLSLPDASYWPLKPVPVVRLDESGERELVECEWGLLPLWWKPSDKCPKRASFQRQCFNAKSETADTKPAFRDAFKRRRCLLPAVEFFEKGHYFHRADRSTFAFAGLWERWRDGDGETVESCTLLTTEPNELVKSVGHHRMADCVRETVVIWLVSRLGWRDDLLAHTRFTHHLRHSLESTTACRPEAREMEVGSYICYSGLNSSIHPAAICPVRRDALRGHPLGHHGDRCKGSVANYQSGEATPPLNEHR